MSACNACLDADNIPECLTNLTIGTISSLAIAVYVYITNNSTGMIERLETTTDGAGLVTLTAIDNTWLVPDNSYSTYVVLQSATDISTKEDITIGASTADCVNFKVNAVFGDDEIQEAYTNITMTI